MDTKQDGSEVLETTEVQETETAETTSETLSPEEIAELRAKAAKADDLESKNKQLFERLKKTGAEKDTKPEPSQDGLSNKDVLYLAKADIHEDDLDDVLKYAKNMGVTVKDAHTFLKPVLETRAEERKTAAATISRGGARGASKTTGEDILRAAETQGKLPENESDLRALAEARLNRKRRK